MDYRFIAIEGNIGAGKTTLAGLLAADLGCETLFERFEGNAFLKDFYKNPGQEAFKLETSFLIDRYQQLANVSSVGTVANVGKGNKQLISDYCFGKCMVFAAVNLAGDELALFKSFFEVLDKQLPQPDLIIYLRSEPETLKQNITKRGRPYEQNISDEYLEKLTHQYDLYFNTLKGIPILKINADMDFIGQPGIYENIKKGLNQ